MLAFGGTGIAGEPGNEPDPKPVEEPSDPAEEGKCDFYGLALPLGEAEGDGKLTNCSKRAASIHHESTDRDKLVERYLKYAIKNGYKRQERDGDPRVTKGDITLELSAFRDTDNGELDIIIQTR